MKQNDKLSDRTTNKLHIFQASYFYERTRALIKYRYLFNNNKFLVAPAGQKGEGLFTTKDIQKGEVVFVAKGPLRTWHSTTETDAQQNLNWYGVHKDIWVDLQLPFVKANHSCHPNMGIDGARIFVALKNIKQGEELLFDYSITDEEDLWSMDYIDDDGSSGTIGPIQTLTRERYLRSYPFIPKYFRDVYEKYQD